MARPRLKSIGNRVVTLDLRNVQTATTSTTRMTGRGLQARRQRIWSIHPNCARCGRLTIYPWGFELDHIVPLYQGGEDVDSNCQILCNGDDGCHLAKTAEDARKGVGG